MVDGCQSRDNKCGDFADKARHVRDDKPGQTTDKCRQVVDKYGERRLRDKCSNGGQGQPRTSAVQARQGQVQAGSGQGPGTDTSRQVVDKYGDFADKASNVADKAGHE